MTKQSKIAALLINHPTNAKCVTFLGQRLNTPLPTARPSLHFLFVEPARGEDEVCEGGGVGGGDHAAGGGAREELNAPLRVHVEGADGAVQRLFHELAGLRGDLLHCGRHLRGGPAHVAKGEPRKGGGRMRARGVGAWTD